jgi:hypothetical protein
VAQQEFGQAVSRAQKIGADVFATAEQIAGRFFLFARNVDGGEGAGPVQHRQVTRITTVGFNAVAGSTRNQRGRNHVARNLVRSERALQLEAARPGFVTTGHRALALRAWDEPQDRRDIRRQRMQRRFLVPRE